MKKISIMGAGFAGMTLALQLAKKGFHVDLYEKSPRVGGLLGTDILDSGIAERAANALIRTDQVELLFQELGLTPVLPLETAKKRFLFRDSPRRWPLSFWETLCFISRLGTKMLRGKKALAPRPQETLKTWGDRNLGSAPTQFILGPAMQGIYGNDVRGLSASLILGPLFHRKKKNRYGGLMSGPQGMQNIVDHLEKRLRALGVQIHLNSSIDLKSLQHPVVIATSAAGAASLLAETAPSTSALLAKIRMSSLMSVTLFFAKAQSAYKGFGCLIPRDGNLQSLGILMNSYIFPHRDKVYNETWILGGIDNDTILNLSDDDLLRLLAQERHRILGHAESLVDFRVNRWKNALPYYDLQLEQAVNLLKTSPPPADIFLHGNYLSGIGLSKILDRSEELAQEIEKRYG
ncbi:MAG: FAD-dependent oxidoreductase [Bdellovibrio sp.]|nr:FAD-dependent oxidoreductase [Bdellovibrio sp.]